MTEKKTTGYEVAKATIKDSYGKKCRQGEIAQLTSEAAKDMKKRGFVTDVKRAKVED